MILFLVEGQCVREDIYYVQDGSQISSYLPPVGSDSVQFSDDHAGKII